jgi:glycosyltransferase involved in cell wall biosynthesis
MNSLVTVVVATYNSSPFVIESLESIVNQTWDKIELIITDDCSRDDTVEVCREWLNKNRQRFISTELITIEQNSGVPANVNRGLNKSHGEWISFLAGDDTLKPDCIRDNMMWIEKNPDARVLFSRIDVYRDTFEPKNLIETVPGDQQNSNGIMAPGRTADSQYRMLLLCDRIHFTPSVFLHRETLLKINGFDERFKLIEDYPLWLKLTRNGYKLHFMESVTVNYRRHSRAINNTGISHLVNPNYYKQENLRKIYTYPFLPVDVFLNQRFTWYALQIFRINRINRNKFPNRMLLLFLTTLINPFKYFIHIRKMMIKQLKVNEFYM